MVIQNGFYLDAFESVTGEVGSGSTFIRWVNLQVALAIALDNPFWGIGAGNYKLFYVEYVYLLDFPIILDLVVLTDPNYMTGGIDATNYFAGFLADFGFIAFIGVFWIIFNRIFSLMPKRDFSLIDIK